MLQGHLMHYDFYTNGRAPLPSLTPPRPPPPAPPPTSIYPRHPSGPRLKNRQHKSHPPRVPAGRTPVSHRCSRRQGDGVVMVMTFRNCTLAEAVSI